jgi:hypothetical protein
MQMEIIAKRTIRLSIIAVPFHSFEDADYAYTGACLAPPARQSFNLMLICVSRPPVAGFHLTCRWVIIRRQEEPDMKIHVSHAEENCL